MQIEQVHISTMSGKLLGLKAISTNTLTNDSKNYNFVIDEISLSNEILL